MDSKQKLPGARPDLAHEAAPEKLGDFTMSLRVVRISVLAVGIGVLSAYVALALLRLIGLFTNLFFFGHWDTRLISPVGHHLGPLVILVPVAGALVVGVMARYGSERIRGHGIPEAIESILISGSRVQPKVAFLKLVSSAISIGSGGPFGAEGPIIMTGGSFGSMIAQLFHLTSAERKTLLVAGAAGGMSATFASPVAALLLGVELLLFEWKPRSMIPVALASAAAMGVRRHIMGMGPLFPTPPHPDFIGLAGTLGCIFAGLLAGVVSIFLTLSVYAAEDGFGKLPVHWMWWPALGGIVVGIGGYIFPEALGVGYDVIGKFLAGEATLHLILGILLIKWTIWAVSLGSGTSGGVVAPLLLVGGALGALEAHFLPAEGAGFWALVSMGATLGGTMRVPITSVVFAVELTHDINMLYPLLIASAFSYGVTVLALRRSILTEKLARRGYHLSCEYAVDPLEILFVREVMRTNVLALPSNLTLAELAKSVKSDHRRSQRLLPVVDPQGALVGVLTRNEVQAFVRTDGQERLAEKLEKLARPNPVQAHPDEPLRVVVQRMAETGITRFPVVERGPSRKLLGLVSLDDLLKARVRNLEEERRRETVLPVRIGFPGLGASASPPPPDAKK